jgi:hypothetical protein
MILTGAAVVAVGLGAYGLGRVYPPLGPSEGTIGASQRYVNAQVSDKDVTLGDTSVPELMQTDAFEAMVRNPSFRALAADANFATLAQNPIAMSALTAHWKLRSPAGDPFIAEDVPPLRALRNAEPTSTEVVVQVSPSQSRVLLWEAWPISRPRRTGSTGSKHSRGAGRCRTRCGSAWHGRAA